jgi:flagellar hook-associated protein 3 FlgL
MLPSVKGSTEKYLADLDRIQATMDLVQRQVSSGVRVERPSDDPAAVSSILDKQSQIAASTQAQSNLNQLTTELDTGDSALQQAIKSVEQAISLSTQAGSTLSSSQSATLLQQAQDIQSQLVNASRTVVDGRYIFSGDLDQQPLYAVDATKPNGVAQLASAISTRAVADPGGGTIWTAKTAQEIFDARNADGSVAQGNVFAAVGSLITALKNNDASAAQAAGDSLKAADDHLNQQLGLYGIAQNRVADSLNSTANRLVTEKQDLSSLRDTDVASAAVELSQITLQQQAALSARAKVPPQSLFDYLA